MINIIEKMRSQNMRDDPRTDLPPQINGSATITPEVAAFVDATTRQREMMEHYKTRSAQLELELRSAHERITDLEHELMFQREDRDRIYRHDVSIMTSLYNIEAMIIDCRRRAAAEHHAPPQELPDETVHTAVDTPESNQ